MQTHSAEFYPPPPPHPCRAKNNSFDKAQFLKGGERRILMNHNHWPEWIIVLRDDIFPGGFLPPPFAQAHAVCCCRKRRRPSADAPSFSWRRDGGLHNRRGLCCGAALSGRDTCRRQPDGAPPAGRTRGLHLDRVGEKRAGTSGETRREMMSNTHTHTRREKEEKKTNNTTETTESVTGKTKCCQMGRLSADETE